ncbi:methyltransferase domain-containing protein [Niabella aurantiaca]|uniref:methyltransferase domain-containing protein n=1 Tax=Niabella aurantiaca TaxID=379900 RepID=UPI00036EB396|nr:methyltransferase domain-containing protein [Niabella aurantiaca]
MSNSISYTPLEKLSVGNPVHRINYLKKACTGRNVLDLGCYDETALVKNDSGFYLFDEISAVCKTHIGVDNSAQMPEEGILYTENIKMLKGDIYHLEKLDFNHQEIDVIIAGELIEHLPDTLMFLKKMKSMFQGKRLICSTPNATSFFNLGLAFIKRESAHKDHFQVYSYKTLNTLCRNAGFGHWHIIPYHVRFTEMILNSRGLKKELVKISEKLVNFMEYCFPLTGGGYIIDIVL